MTAVISGRANARVRSVAKREGSHCDDTREQRTSEWLEMKMPKKWNEATRVRLIGLWASVIPVAALSTTVLSGNPSAGLGRSITRDEQVFLLLIAALLCALQPIAYLIHRRRTPQSATGPLRSAAPSARNQSSRDL